MIKSENNEYVVKEYILLFDNNVIFNCYKAEKCYIMLAFFDGKFCFC